MPSCVEKIVTENGRILYENNSEKVKVFSDDTVELINDSLKDCIEYGTSKNLNCNLSNLRAKTGTSGTKNGNTDAYSISFNPQYTLGVWYGNKTNKLMENSISGGTYPTLTASSIWNELYVNSFTNNQPFNKSENITELDIDKISYENENTIELADDIAPNRYTVKEKFRKSNIPTIKSSRFSSPSIETPQISINNNIISIRLCQTQLYNFEIYKEFNGINRLFFDTKYQSFNSCIFDHDIIPNTLYSYTVIPYYEKDGIKYNGIPVQLNKIKTCPFLSSDNWWDKDVN
jgi:membrane carboxypeptidase/penicillin-binding protein PbpC